MVSHATQFCSALSGIRAEQVMQNEHYKELSDTIGIKLMPDNVNGDDNIFDASANADPYLSIINLARRKKYRYANNIIKPSAI